MKTRAGSSERRALPLLRTDSLPTDRKHRPSASAPPSFRKDARPSGTREDSTRSDSCPHRLPAFRSKRMFHLTAEDKNLPHPPEHFLYLLLRRAPCSVNDGQRSPTLRLSDNTHSCTLCRQPSLCRIRGYRNRPSQVGKTPPCLSSGQTLCRPTENAPLGTLPCHPSARLPDLPVRAKVPPAATAVRTDCPPSEANGCSTLPWKEDVSGQSPLQDVLQILLSGPSGAWGAGKNHRRRLSPPFPSFAAGMSDFSRRSRFGSGTSSPMSNVGRMGKSLIHQDGRLAYRRVFWSRLHELRISGCISMPLRKIPVPAPALRADMLFLPPSSLTL